MSLQISNKATNKQKEMLYNLGYYGRGKWSINSLTKQEASEIIQELFEEERLENKEGTEKWD